MERYNLIPLFVEANTKEDLVNKMLKINIKANSYHRFFDIQKDGKKWVGWYYTHVEIKVNDVLNKK